MITLPYPKGVFAEGAASRAHGFRRGNTPEVRPIWMRSRVHRRVHYHLKIMVIVVFLMIIGASS
jgi:hypothetical protein